MDIHAYIKSGIIESYLLGIAGDDEKQELDQMRRLYPEVENAIHSAEDWLQGMATPISTPVPSGIREKIFARIGADIRDTPMPVEIRISNPVYKYTAAASVVLLISSIAANFILYNKYTAEKEQVIALQDKQQNLLADQQIIQAKMSTMGQDLHLLTAPGIVKIGMPALPGKGNGQSTLFIDAANNQLLLAAHSLPAAPQNKQYQLWAIVKGKPVNAGMLVNAEELCKFAAITGAEAYAVTLEPAGGSVNPTLEQMYIYGKVNG